jgi:hypothetical protein
MSREARVTVIGAGASGLMAAVRAAQCGAEVKLFERNNRAGVKLAITGKGRCNVTNDCDAETFLNNCNNKKFLRSALARFSPQDAMAFFEDIGVPLVTERGRRVFPQSGLAADIVDALTGEAKRLGVSIVYGRRVQPAEELISDGGILIIATGGLSYPKTGSDGDGYEIARLAGHTVAPLSPGLVPLESADSFCAELQGLSLRNVTLRLVDGGGKEAYAPSAPGEMLFTHFGISGPLVLSASGHWREGLTAVIDLKPGLTEEQLYSRIERDLIKYGARELGNSLNELLHKRMIAAVIAAAGLCGKKRAAETTRAERLALLGAVKRFPIVIAGRRPMDEAVVTRGGVCLKEIDPGTMRSKKRKGLYFTGEVLDLDGATGGYNLQIAWSTGWAAGESAAGGEKI